MTVNELVEWLLQFNGDRKVFINTESGMEEFTTKMINNDFLLEWVDGKPLQGDEIIAIYPLS